MSPQVFSAVAAWAWESSDGAHRRPNDLVFAKALLALHADSSMRPRLFSGLTTGTSLDRSPWSACGLGDVSLS
jgi:hypothetical protein